MIKEFEEKYFKGGMRSSYKNYHEISRSVYNLTLKFLKKFLEYERVDPSKLSILIVGCAYGYECKACKDFGFKRVVGVDISEHAIKEAKKIFSDIEFMVADANDLPFEDDNFDIIMANNLLEHIPDFRKTLKEFHRVSKKYLLARLDNVFIIELYNTLPLFIRKIISKVKKLPLELDTDLTHISQLPRYKWIQFFEAYGFRIKKIFSINGFPLLLTGYHHYILEVVK